jgi:hypothetical protein
MERTLAGSDSSLIQIEKFAHGLAASTGEFLDHHTRGAPGRSKGTESRK